MRPKAGWEGDGDDDGEGDDEEGDDEEGDDDVSRCASEPAQPAAGPANFDL